MALSFLTMVMPAISAPERKEAFDKCVKEVLSPEVQQSFEQCRKDKKSNLEKGLSVAMNKKRCVKDIPQNERQELFKCVKNELGQESK